MDDSGGVRSGVSGSATGTGHDDRGPAVLIIGGLLTSPWWYWTTKRRLLARGATHVTVAPLFGWHWLAAAFVGLGPVTSIVARTIDRLSDEDGRRPILVVGHSGGGIVARLALAARPFEGARRVRPRAVGVLVTMGTPHLATRVDGTLGRHGLRALRFLARYGRPGGPAAPGPGVLTLGSTFTEDEDGGGGPILRRLRRDLARSCYVALMGPMGRRARGDGMVPLECALLPDTEQITLDGFAHGPLVWGSRWYGSDGGLDIWWDRAVELWRRSLPRPGRRARGGERRSTIAS